MRTFDETFDNPEWVAELNRIHDEMMKEIERDDPEWFRVLKEGDITHLMLLSMGDKDGKD